MLDPPTTGRGSCLLRPSCRQAHTPQPAAAGPGGREAAGGQPAAAAGSCCGRRRRTSGRPHSPWKAPGLAACGAARAAAAAAPPSPPRPCASRCGRAAGGGRWAAGTRAGGCAYREPRAGRRLLPSSKQTAGRKAGRLGQADGATRHTPEQRAPHGPGCGESHAGCGVVGCCGARGRGHRRQRLAPQVGDRRLAQVQLAGQAGGGREGGRKGAREAGLGGDDGAAGRQALAGWLAGWQVLDGAGWLALAVWLADRQAGVPGDVCGASSCVCRPPAAQPAPSRYPAHPAYRARQMSQCRAACTPLRSATAPIQAARQRWCTQRELPEQRQGASSAPPSSTSAHSSQAVHEWVRHAVAHPIRFDTLRAWQNSTKARQLSPPASSQQMRHCGGSTSTAAASGTAATGDCRLLPRPDLRRCGGRAACIPLLVGGKKSDPVEFDAGHCSPRLSVSELGRYSGYTTDGEHCGADQGAPAM